MSDRNCWSTPASLFAPLNARHHFDVDVCAEDWNTKVPSCWYGVGANGLKQSWAGRRVWCNPPYGRGLIQPWVEKALTDTPTVAALLLPSRTDTPWFQRLWKESQRGDLWVQIEFLPERVRFVPPPGITASSPTEASLLVVVRN